MCDSHPPSAHNSVVLVCFCFVLWPTLFSVELQCKLGEGAFAEVWLGRHRVLGFEVAVKTIQLSSDPKRAAKEMVEIKDEIDVLQLCQNKYIVAYKGVSQRRRQRRAGCVIDALCC